jgi:2-oxoglutarate ferredoxin oxidoreductase subunit beta
MQVSPTSPKGLRSNTTPRGAYLEALNPLTVTLGVQNVSFVAQAVDWIPEAVYSVISAAYHHKGFSFVRIIQRCPEFLPKMWEPWLHDPDKTQLLTHEDGLKYSSGLTKVYKNCQRHDPSDIHRAREIASVIDPVPVGILYRNPDVPCYEELRESHELRTADLIRTGLEAELDKFTVWPDSDEEARAEA